MKQRALILISIFIFAMGCAHQHKTTVAPKPKLKEDPYYYLIRSNLEAYAGKMEDSVRDLEKTSHVFPHDPYLQFIAAERYAQLHRWEEASKNIQAVLKQKPDWKDAELLWGSILEASGDPHQAGKIFEKLIRQSPAREENYLKLAQSLIDQKKYKEAVVVLNRLLAKVPDSVSAYIYLATIHLTYLKNQNEGLRFFKKCLEIDPENIRIRQQIAQIYLNQNKFKEALDQFLVIEEQYPSDLGTKLHIALLYQELGNVDESIVRLKNILKANPKADRIYYYLGLIFEKLKRYPEAIEYFSGIPKSSGVYKDGVIHAASIYNELKQNDDAIRVLREGIRKSPKIPQFYQLLSLLYEDQKNLEKGVDVLKQGIRELPDEEVLYFNLGILYDKLHNKKSSLQAMKKVLVLNPENSSALNYIGYTYAEEGKNLDEAETMIQKALKIKPGDPYILDSLGWVYFQRGQLDKAYLYIYKAFQTSPKEVAINEHLGDIFLKRGKKNEALKYFRRALEFSKAKEDQNPEEIKRLENKIQ